MALLGEIGPGELLVVFVAILLLFGSKRLPEIARTIGRTLEDLRHASQQFRDQLMNADNDAPGWKELPPLEGPSAGEAPATPHPAPENPGGTAPDPAGPRKDSPRDDLAG
jgi:sec-independent protein translocase protein TatA